MFVALSLLLIAWFVAMPLWLSIVVTVLSGITILVKLLVGLFDIFKDYIEEHEKRGEE